MSLGRLDPLAALGERGAAGRYHRVTGSLPSPMRMSRGEVSVTAEDMPVDDTGDPSVVVAEDVFRSVVVVQFRHQRFKQTGERPVRSTLTR